MGSPAMVVDLVIPADQDGARLDKGLAAAAATLDAPLSRTRITQLIQSGAVKAPDGREITEPKGKVKAGDTYQICIPPPTDAVPQAQAIPLDVVFEDDDLIVVNKPAGMVVHPAPGTPDGTLVNALLAHCGDSLAGIGGERRPGIVHRIDKDTSGLLVAAKTELAHTGLSDLFARHDIQRRYVALVWGAPDRGDPRLAARPGVSFGADGWTRIETHLGRHPGDRTKQAVVGKGRNAITHLHTVERFGPREKPFVSLIEAELETGRTHQIRVHADHIGHSLIGDPAYGSPRAIAKKAVDDDLSEELKHFPRQALHAANLGFRHPKNDNFLEFSAKIPADMNGLLTRLRGKR